MSFTLLASQLVSAFVLLVSTLLVGTLPSYLGSRAIKSNKLAAESHSGSPPAKRSASFENLLSFLMNFGGGVLLATCLVHMLPEARESFEKHAEQVNMSGIVVNSTGDEDEGNSEDSFPMAELLVCVGFFLVYLAEELVHACLSHSHQHHAHTPSNLLFDNRETMNGQKKKGYKESKAGASTARESRLIHEGSLIDEVGSNYGATIDESDNHSDQALLLPSSLGRSSHHRDKVNESRRSSVRKSIELASESFCNVDIESRHKDKHNSAVDHELPIFRCFVLIFALSFHSIFDGLAIGIQETVVHVWELLLAISVHKLLIAFVVGLDIYAETLSMRRVLVYMAPFSAMSPIGVLVAALSKTHVSDQVTGVLSAISTGSVLYITFFEVLFRERVNSKLAGLLQFCAVLVGFILMTLITMIPEHEQ